MPFRCAPSTASYSMLHGDVTASVLLTTAVAATSVWLHVLPPLRCRSACIASHTLSDVRAQHTNAHARSRIGVATRIRSSSAHLRSVAALDRGDRLAFMPVSTSTTAQKSLRTTRLLLYSLPIGRISQQSTSSLPAYDPRTSR
jgi:hypothetical protein